MQSLDEIKRPPIDGVKEGHLHVPMSVRIQSHNQGNHMSSVLSSSGSHGTGKSTYAGQIYHEQKRKNPNASVRLLCDLEADCPYPINHDTTEQSQLWIFSNQIRAELFALSRFDILVTDRTVVDTIAYTYCAGFQELACAMLGLAQQHVGLYNEINFRQIKNNPFCYPDGIRETDDFAFRLQVECTLKEMYSELESEGFIAGTIYYV